ncbi:MAG TPA: acyl carrier protein [Stellaceae bacterium]|nr:acyl carrier protein [Stellaceae bacterium]
MPPSNASHAEICDWCVAYLKRIVADPSTAITPDATFAQMGLDSATSAYFIVELEEWLGVELEPELVFEHPTITDLARHIVTQRAPGDTGDG